MAKSKVKKTGKITDRVKTWEDVCEIKGIDPVRSLPFQNVANDEEGVNDTEEGVNAFFQISTIREVLNEGKDADWGNSSEIKYCLWPKVVKDETKPSGFGLSWGGYDGTYTGTRVGSRLSFRSAEIARHFFDHFLPILEKFMLITPSK